MEIKVYGPGCARCSQTETLVKDVLTANGVEASVVKVSDMKEMMTAGIMSTPAVAIDGVVKSTGKIPTKEEVASWLTGTTVAAPTSPAAKRTGGKSCSCCGKC